MFGKLFLLFARFKRKCIERYYVKSLNRCGEHIFIGEGCALNPPKNISIGDHVYFGKNCLIQSVHGEIIIGSHVMFGPGVNVHGGNHIIDNIGYDDYMDRQIKNFGDDSPIVIEDDVWIGANAIILAGVHIGKGAVVGAGSVVTRDVTPYSVFCGVPAKFIRSRKMKDN